MKNDTLTEKTCAKCGKTVCEDNKYKQCNRCREIRRKSNKNYNRSEKGKVARRKNNANYRRKCIELGICIKHPSRLGENGICPEECYWRRVSFRATDTELNWKMLKLIYYKQGKKCIYTGEILSLGININCDHGIPITRDGLYNVENLAFTLAIVNKIKDVLTTEEFLLLCKHRWEQQQQGIILKDDISQLLVRIHQYQLDNNFPVYQIIDFAKSLDKMTPNEKETLYLSHSIYPLVSL